MAVREPESVLHVARRMFGRDVERVEVVIFGFHFGAVEDGEAKRSEQILDFVLDDGYRMQAAGARAGRRAGEIEPFALQTGVQRGAREIAFPGIKCAFQSIFRIVERFSREFPLLGRQFTQIELGERSLAAENVDANLLQRVQIGGVLNLVQRLRLELLDLLFDHAAYASSRSTVA